MRAGTRTGGLKPFIDTDHFEFRYGQPDETKRLIDSQFVSSTRVCGRIARTGR